LAGGSGAPAGPGRWGGHAGSGHLRRGAQCLRHRPEPQQFPGGRVHRPAPIHDAPGSGGGAGPRNEPRGQRGHGDPDPDPGGGEYLCLLPRPGGGLSGG